MVHHIIIHIYKTDSGSSLTCQLFLQPFYLLVQLLDLLVSAQSSSSGRRLQGLGRLYTARGHRSGLRQCNTVTPVQKWDGGLLLTLQLAVQLLLLLLQPPDPLLKHLYLLTSCSALLRLPQAECCPTDGTAVSEAASRGEGEAHEGEMLTGEASVRRGRADVLQGETEGETSQSGC